MQENHKAAAAVLDRAAPLSARTGTDHELSHHALRSWGDIRYGRFNEARARLEPAITAATELGDLNTLGIVLNFYAQALQAVGRADEADALLRDALDEADDRGARYPTILLTVALALNELELGRPRTCRTMIAAHRSAATEAGLVLGFMYDIVDACAAIAEGDWTAARAGARVSMEYADMLESVWGRALAEVIDGVALRHLDQASTAEDIAHAALRSAHDQGFMPLVAEALELIAGVATDKESYEEAGRLFGAAGAIRASLGMRTPRRCARELDADYAALRQALGDETFDLVQSQGAQMDANEAIAYATRTRGERKRPSVGWDSLTPREHDVVRLAAQGLTNPQIAEKLFVSRGTIKAHLARVFDKLAITTRAELAAEATRRNTTQRTR